MSKYDQTLEQRELGQDADGCQHTACPAGYLAWHEWAAHMHRTHVSTKCPGCGLYKLWVPREKALTDKQMKRSLGYVPASLEGADANR